MSDRIAVFNHGRIEQVGTPAEVYERPATPFVAGFVGTSNLLRRRARAAVARPRRHLHRAAREDPPVARRRDAGAGAPWPTRRRRSSATSSTSAPTPASSSPLDAGADLVASVAERRASPDSTSARRVRSPGRRAAARPRRATDGAERRCRRASTDEPAASPRGRHHDASRRGATIGRSMAVGARARRSCGRLRRDGDNSSSATTAGARQRQARPERSRRADARQARRRRGPGRT